MKPTQEQVIAWAREAGFEDWHWTSLEGESELDRTLQVGEYPVGESVFALVSLAYEAGRKDENEACANVLDDMADDMVREMEPSAAIEYVRRKAATIRARVKP